MAGLLPSPLDFAGRKLQRGEAVRPTELAILSIQADPVQIAWIGDGRPPRELLTASLVHLGKANGIVVLYSPPLWEQCPVVDSCRGATWKVHERDVLLRIEANPPDRHAP